MVATPSDLEPLRPGEGLEREVARIYSLLGAKTERRLGIDMYEVDIRVVMQQGPTSIPFIVECKEYSADRAVSSKDMALFVVKVAAAKRLNMAYMGVFVTTSRFSQDARATAHEHGIQCLTLRELRNQLVNFQQYLEEVIASFESTNLSRWYVDQAVSEFEDYDALAPDDLTRSLHSPALDYIESVFEEEGRAALLGNFGTGKTALCRALLVRLARRALVSPDARIPVLLDLRDFRSDLDIQQAIVNAIQRLPGVDATRRVCEELQRLGRFFFLLDGLDEMASRVDRTVINESLRAIDKLRTSGDNKYLLTCRTHFFQERISDEFLTDYFVLYLTEWNRPQLETYFRKRFGAEGPAKCERTLENPQIAELARTPLLLDILLATEDGQADLHNVFGLLSKYTDNWITKQSKRRGAVMSPSQRRRFAIDLAHHMYLENLTELHFSNLYEVARVFSGHRNVTEMDHFDTDARTCTFITKDSKGCYSFRPQTFFDFFAAEAIANRIEAGESGTLATREPGAEIISLIAGRGLNDAGVANLHQWSAGFENERLSLNAARLLNALGQDLSPEVRQHYDVHESDIQAFQEASSGDINEQLEQLVREHRHFLLRRARAWSFKTQTMDHEDLVQETFLRFLALTHKNPSRLRTYMNVQAYLYAVMRSVVLNYTGYARRRRPIVSMDDPEVSGEVENFAAPDADASGGLESAQLNVELSRAMLRLSEEEQMILRLRMQGHTVIDIADRLGQNVATTRRLLASAMKLLRLKLGGSGHSRRRKQ